MTDTAEIPYAATAVRPGWAELPGPVRDLIQTRIGSPVVRVSPAGGGFTGGFAASVVPAGGAPVFVKAASALRTPVVANAYRQEGQVGAALPPEVPAPRCHWSAEVDDWVVLGFAHVAGRMPRTPCDQDELDAVLAAWTTAADALAELESRWAAAVVADSAIHCDLRLDNVIIDAAGAAWICDWNWPCLGAAWFDTVQVLLVPYGLGADADAALRRHPTARGVAPEQIDAVLAGFAGAFFDNAVRPPIADCSPYLRAHQRLSGHAALDWLTVRRRWR